VPVYFGLYRVNFNIPPPPTPQDAVRMYEGFAALIRSQMQAGILKEAHGFVDSSGNGYFITGDVSDEVLYEALAMWAPFVSFELHRTIPYPKAIDLVVSAAKKVAEQR